MMQTEFTRGGDVDEYVVQLTGRHYNSVSEAIVHIIAAYTDREPHDLKPLNTSVDPDALDALTASALETSSTRLRKVAFDYAGFRITISTTGEVRLRRTGDRN